MVAPVNGAINLISLGLLLWGLSYQAHPSLTAPVSHLAGLALPVAATAGWLGWFYTRFRPGAQTLHLASLIVMALAGGALAAFAPLAVTSPGVAALGATATWPLGRVALPAADPPDHAIRMSAAPSRRARLLAHEFPCSPKLRPASAGPPISASMSCPDLSSPWR